MRRTLALSLALSLSLSLGLLSGCGPAAPAVQAQELTAQPVSVQPAGSPAVDQALTSFGLSLLQSAREAESGPVLLSPLSAALALSMAANGADGDTLAQFETVFGGGVTLDELNAACAQLLSDYGDLDGSTECLIANSLWTDPEGMIREDFIGKCQGIFDAQVFSQDLSAPSVVPAVNSWVSEHTNKMIPSILSEPFNENAALLLVNALYLKNTWETEFDPNNTYLRGFYHQGSDKESMDFLNAGFVTFPYLQSETAQGAVLPYDDGRLGFFVLMPKLSPDMPDFGEWLDSLEGESLSQLILSGEEAKFLCLSLPKFEQEWNGELQDILPDMGLESAFDPDAADFSLMGDSPYGYYLSRVIHAAKIEVNEKGTEAAAATVAAAESGSSAPVEGITLIADRSFLYGIVDLQTGIPLFLGTFE